MCGDRVDAMQRVSPIRGVEEPRISLILKEQLAAQAVAVIGAHWVRPNPAETLDILRRAAQQVEAMRPAPAC